MSKGRHAAVNAASLPVDFGATPRYVAARKQRGRGAARVCQAPFLRPSRRFFSGCCLMSLKAPPARGRVRASAREPSHPGKEMRLTLIRSFELTIDDRSVALPMSVQRLLTFLALQDRPMQRPYVAGTLWLDASEEHAAASLRSVVWRLNRADARLIQTSGPSIWLSADLRIDLRERIALAHRLLSDHATLEIEIDQAPFCDDLLPDWYDDWLVIERERFHQLRLRALELICEHLTAMGQFAGAIEAGLSAVAGEPLRESAHRSLVKVHLAEGNRSEALRQFHLYRKLLHTQLGLKPSSQMLELLQPPVQACP